MRAQIVFRNTPPRAVILIFMRSDSAGQSTQSQQEVFSQGGAVCSKKQTFRLSRLPRKWVREALVDAIADKIRLSGFSGF